MAMAMRPPVLPLLLLLALAAAFAARTEVGGAAARWSAGGARSRTCSLGKLSQALGCSEPAVLPQCKLKNPKGSSNEESGLAKSVIATKETDTVKCEG
ncbi:hypothetical protein ABZP36_032318 [Zizania latifolia]